VPELPDVELYIDALSRRILHQPLERFRIGNPFIVRTIAPPPADLETRTVADIHRMGKRIVLGFSGDLYLVVHLMIAGRFRWRERGTAIPNKVGLAAFDFPNGTLILTEAGSRRQASIHIVRGEATVSSMDPGGLEVLTATAEEFVARLRGENHTVKRSLTDPHIFSGIGNAYSDEILHAARMSPLKLTHALSGDEAERLFYSAREVLDDWQRRLKEETGDDFPEKVTAFRPGMAVHGRFGQPCPVCGAPVQRIVYARNEANYCSRCQTGGRLLSDRSLARLLKDDWPTTLDELEERRRKAGKSPR
jgi:formamidopyrimidine-DNA glycosylase